jgi:phage shock protein G
MFELIFILVFFATLLVTGVTLFTVFAAVAFSMVVMLLLGMVGAAIKLIPWLIVIAIGVWFFKTYVAQPRTYNRR